jgi:iron complex outermembrane recepter protein
MARRPRLRGTVPLMTLALSGSWVADAQPAPQRIELSVPAGPAPDSLAALAKEAKCNILFLDGVAEDVPTNPVSGASTPADALSKMLAGTPLTFTVVNEHTITVRRREQPPDSSDSSGSSTRPAANHGARPSTHPIDTGGSPVEQVDVNGIRRRLGDFVPQPSLEKIVVNKDQVAQTGAITLPEALRSLTQILNGGATEGNIQTGREAATNGNHATGLNVRGLGPAATLVLFDGHRTVKGGTDAMYTEFDMFPQMGLEKVELQADGPPLMYGADAIGGVVNIVMNRQFLGQATEFQSNGLSSNARREYRLGHMQGWQWGGTHFEFALELSQQDALAASKRSQYSNDLTRFGGSDFRTPYSQPGTILAGSQMYKIPSGQDGTALTPSSFSPNTANLTDQLAGTDVFPRQQRWNSYLELDRSLADGVIASAESLCSYRQAKDNAGAYTAAITVDQRSPFYVNPAGGTEPITVFYKFAHEFGSTIERAGVTNCGLTLALDAKAFSGWNFSGSVGYGTERQRQTTGDLVDFPSLESALTQPRATAFNPLGDGTGTTSDTINTFRSSSHFSSRNDQWDINAAADHRLLSLLSRDLTLTLGAEYRRETLATRSQDFKSAPETSSNLGRNVSSAFGQLTIPMTDRATFQASGRFDHYSDFGSVFSPEYTLKVVPTRSIWITGTWARLFRPPNISQLVESHDLSQLSTLPDARSSTGSTLALIDSGGNSQLKQELSRNWAVNIEFRPPTLPTLRANLNYFHVNSENRIEDPSFQPNVLNNPEFTSMVNRNPTAAYRQAICSNGQFAGSASSCLSAPIGAIIDLRTRNTAILTTSGFDLGTSYAWPSAWGQLEAGLRGTYVFDFSAAQTADSPKLQLRNTPNNPVDLRLRPMLQWSMPRLTTMVAVNYWNHYRDTASTPNRDVASWTTVDMQVSYKVSDAHGSLLDGTEISLTATNLLDRDPPFVNDQLGVGYDLVNGDLRGRVVGIVLRKHW